MASTPRLLTFEIALIIVILTLSSEYSSVVGFYPNKVHVYITNELDGGRMANIHCRSADDDLEERTLASYETYEFRFHVNFGETTKFWCKFGFVDSNHHVIDATFDIYDAKADIARCGKFCPRYIRNDGLYFNNTRDGVVQLERNWPKPQPPM